jgi:hypothetical protein
MNIARKAYLHLVGRPLEICTLGRGSSHDVQVNIDSLACALEIASDYKFRESLLSGNTSIERYALGVSNIKTKLQETYQASIPDYISCNFIATTVYDMHIINSGQCELMLMCMAHRYENNKSRGKKQLKSDFLAREAVLESRPSFVAMGRHALGIHRDMSMETTLLQNAIKIAYPEREQYKYDGLLATVFKYAYEDCAERVQYLSEKQMYWSLSPTQYDLSKKYLIALAAVLNMGNIKIADAREKVRKLLFSYF